MTMAETNAELSLVEVVLDGTSQRDLVRNNLLDVLVEQDLFLPDCCTLRFADVKDEPALSAMGYYTLIDQDTFQIGSSLLVKLAHEATPEPVFDGEVTSIELDLELDRHPALVVRALDRSHRLRRERKTRAFVNVTDAAIVQEVGADHGLSVQASSPGVVYDHVFQDNQTDWDFLRARATRIGYDLFVDSRTLHFRPMGEDRTTVTVTAGQDLHRARLRLAAQSQVTTAVVHGWDPHAKQVVTGTASQASKPPQIGESRSGAQLASSGFGAGKAVLSERVISDQTDATRRAQALYDQIAGDFVQVDGACLGRADLRPGRSIHIKGIGTRLSGTYLLSSVTHRRRRGESYVSNFVVGGRRPATLAGALGNGHAVAGGRGSADLPVLHPSVVVGVVTNSNDPDQLGRVKVRFPWLDAGSTQPSGVESTWARVASPMAGSGRGLIWLPEVNDEVLVAFEHGDINRPFVVGAVWNGSDHPPAPSEGALVNATGKVDRRLIKSRKGHTILLDDSDTSPSIIVTSNGGHSIKIDDATETPSVTVKSKTGHTLKLDDAAASSKISLIDKTGSNTITVDSLTNTVSIKAAANMSLEATGQMTIKGATVSIEGTATFALKGPIGSVEANGPLSVKGLPIKLN